MKSSKQVVACFFFLSITAFLLCFGMPDYQTICQNRLNKQLLRAVTYGDVPAATMLLKQGASANTKENNPIVSFLFRMTNEGDIENGVSVLMLACAEEKVPLVQLLLQYGADVNKKDAKGTTALMWSVMTQNSHVVMLLLDKGADVNAFDSQGATALIQAAKRGDLRIVKQLLKHGADAKVHDKQNHTALAWAIHNQFSQIGVLLKQAGATK